MPQSELVEILGHFKRRDIPHARADLDLQAIIAGINRLSAAQIIKNVFGREDDPFATAWNWIDGYLQCVHGAGGR